MHYFIAFLCNFVTLWVHFKGRRPTEMAPAEPRAYYKIVAQLRDYDKVLPLCRLDYPVPWQPGTHLHYHNGLEFGHCRSGQGVFIVGGKVRPFRTGDVSVIDRSEPHLAQSVPGVTSDWHWVQMDVVAMLAPLCRDMSIVDHSTLCGPRFPNVFSPDQHPVLCALVVRLFDEVWGAREFRETRIRALTLDTMIELQRMKDLKRAMPARHELSVTERVVPAINHIAANYAVEISVARLAELCRLGQTQFRKLFTRETGMAPRRYITEMRVGMACAMMRESSKQIGRVAAECGFSTLSSFNRAFRAVTGTTPRDWRRR
jgi:AraC-like DNA-binding protein